MVVFIPIVAKDNYGVLKDVLREVAPETYAGWLDQVKKWREHWQQQGAVKFVAIQPTDFKDFITERNLPASLNSLMDFAEWASKARPDDTAS